MCCLFLVKLHVVNIYFIRLLLFIFLLHIHACVHFQMHLKKENSFFFSLFWSWWKRLQMFFENNMLHLCFHSFALRFDLFFSFFFFFFLYYKCICMPLNGLNNSILNFSCVLCVVCLLNVIWEDDLCVSVLWLLLLFFIKKSVFHHWL